MKHFGIIYLIWCKVTGKKYVGQTTRTLEERFGEHCCADSYIGKAIRKHGRENFICGVIKFCATKDELNACEIFYIAALKSRAPYGYNFTDGGEGTVGVNRTLEQCIGVSAKLRGYSPYENLIIEMDTHFLSYHHLAKSLGLSYSVVACKISGKKKFTIRDIAKLVNIFGKPADYLMKRVDGKNAVSTRGNSPYKNLKSELEVHQISYDELAEILGFTIRSIWGKMAGKYNFTARDIVKLVEVLGKPADYLMERVDGKNAYSKAYNSPYENLSHEIYAHRLTYTALARLMSLSHQNVSAKLRGEVRFTERDKIKLVEIFGKPVEWLLSVNNR